MLIHLLYLHKNEAVRYTDWIMVEANKTDRVKWQSTNKISSIKIGWKICMANV